MITQTTPQAEIDKYLEQEIARREKAIINAVNYVGVTCINEARRGGAYHDRTGNLRNSIGYVLVVNGKIQDESNFDATEGGLTGKAKIQELAARYPEGIVLIVVAGMNYATHVEAMNLNVLTSAELLAEQMVPQLLKQLGFTTD